MCGAQPCPLREALKRNGAIRAPFDFAAHAANEIRMRVARRLARMATPASSESGLFRRIGLNEEENLLCVRAARWARGAAIDPRRADCIDERAVHSRVMQSDCREASPPRERGDCGQHRVGKRRHWPSRSFPTTIPKTIPAALSESCGQSNFFLEAICSLRRDGSVVILFVWRRSCASPRPNRGEDFPRILKNSRASRDAASPGSMH